MIRNTYTNLYITLKNQSDQEKVMVKLFLILKPTWQPEAIIAEIAARQINVIQNKLEY